jgi:hypothetical protein
MVNLKEECEMIVLSEAQLILDFDLVRQQTNVYDLGRDDPL